MYKACPKIFEHIIMILAPCVVDGKSWILLSDDVTFEMWVHAFRKTPSSELSVPIELLDQPASVNLKSEVCYWEEKTEHFICLS